MNLQSPPLTFPLPFFDFSFVTSLSGSSCRKHAHGNGASIKLAPTRRTNAKACVLLFVLTQARVKALLTAPGTDLKTSLPPGESCNVDYTCDEWPLLRPSQGYDLQRLHCLQQVVSAQPIFMHHLHRLRDANLKRVPNTMWL